MNREAWIIFAGLSLWAAIVVLGYSTWNRNRLLLASRAELAVAHSNALSQATRLREAQTEVTRARHLTEALSRDIAAANDSQRRLEEEMRSAMRSRDIGVSNLQGRLTLNILDRILFDSGDAQLKPEGRAVLDAVAHVLGRFTNRLVQVHGHTDNIPIRLRFPSNWELSAARALAAVRYLAETARVDATRLTAVACGEFQPIASNATPEGRAANRRIAIVVLPESFIPSDVTPTSPSAFPLAPPPPLAESPTSSPPSPGDPPEVPWDASDTVPPLLPPDPVRESPLVPALPGPIPSDPPHTDPGWTKPLSRNHAVSSVVRA